MQDGGVKPVEVPLHSLGVEFVVECQALDQRLGLPVGATHRAFRKRANSAWFAGSCRTPLPLLDATVVYILTTFDAVGNVLNSRIESLLADATLLSFVTVLNDLAVDLELLLE